MNEFKLLYITNDVKDIQKLEEAEVDYIFIDLEINGKVERQGHLDTVISNHKIEDIKKIKSISQKIKILTRINPINKESKEEINKAIEYGTDMIMLPMFKRKEEVEIFIRLVNKRCKVCLLLETSEAFCRIDQILELDGIDQIHIGLNDLHLSLGLDFIFEPLSIGLLDILSEKILRKNIKLGIGGIAKIGQGELPAEKIIGEHVRLGSTTAILSRSFKNDNKNLKEEVENVRKIYQLWHKVDKNRIRDNCEEVKKIIHQIIEKKRKCIYKCTKLK